MIVPVKWIRDFVNIDIDAKEFADAMTFTGTKCETVYNQGEDIENVVVGHIKSIDKHPNADKLIITKIDVGQEEPLQIVTGAHNVSVGDKVPVALHGSLLPGGVKIKKGKLRGETSEGMLCSSVELNIEEKYVDEKSKGGILILPEDAPVGEDIKEYLDIKDAIIDFELTSNRPDCLAMIGIAREAAVTLNKEINLPENKFQTVEDKNEFTVKCEDEDLCQRYLLRKVRNVKIEKSPYYMRRRLIEAGIRPINNIVDTTNYVMLEYGQPMHAFDENMIPSKNIVIKRAKNGEKFVTLDDIERELDDSMLMITDGEKSIAIAGVMGGQNSQIKEDTNTIILECASFNMDSVRKTSKKLNLRTDSSSRFEKGIDTQRVRKAMDRACYLIQSNGWGEIVQEEKEYYSQETKLNPIEISIKQLNDKIGNEVSKEEIIDILRRLFMQVEEIDADKIKVTPPSFRMDILQDADILEEITRIYGYNKINSKPMILEGAFATKTPQRKYQDNLKRFLTASGLTEVVAYSFIGQKDLDLVGYKGTDVIRIINPLGEDTSVMRPILTPSMMNIIKRNLSRKNKFFHGFEIGNTFIYDENKKPVEKKQIVAGSYGDDVGFFSLKGKLENVLEKSGIENFKFEVENTNEFYHPQRCAKVTVGDTTLGYIGEVHPVICENYDIKKRIYIFELDFNALFENAEEFKLYKGISKFPPVNRDLAIVVEKNVLVSQVTELIQKTNKDIIEAVELFDIYEGEQLGENKKSLAYSITYRDKNKTLRDEDVNEVQDKILNRLKEKFDAVLRS